MMKIDPDYERWMQAVAPLALQMLASGDFPVDLGDDFISDLTARAVVSFASQTGENADHLIDAVFVNPTFTTLLLERFFEAGYMQALLDRKEGKWNN